MINRESNIWRNNYSRLVAGCLLMAASVALGQTASSLDGDKRAQIDAVVETAMKSERTPGVALGIFRNGMPLYVKGYGFSDLENVVPVIPDSVFQSGSVGKMFTATAVMLLAEEGKLDLDSSIAAYFPQAPATWKPVTVRHLLSHRSGIADYDEKEGFDLRRDYTNDEFVAKFVTWPLNFEPGTQFSYSNTGYVLLGFIIEKASGKFYGDYLTEKVFAPLGMSRTRVNDINAIIPSRAQGYEIKDNALINDEWVSNSLSVIADGSLLLTVPDLGKWDAALRGDALLPQNKLQLMFHGSPFTDGTEPVASYGYGWETFDVRGHRLVAHGGSWQGFRTYLGRFIDDGLTVAVLANLNHAQPNVIARQVAAVIDPQLAPYAVIADANLALTKRLKDAIFAYWQGTPTNVNYASTDVVALKPQNMRRMRTDVGPYEADAKFELVAAPSNDLRTYRLSGKEADVLVDIELTRGRKIKALRFRAE